MKIVHIESGLGNQMLSYCEYLALKKANPDEDIYIENLIYDIPYCNDYIKQWNGYELERIFGISAANIKEVFSDAQWERIMDSIIQSRFWVLEEHNWNYPVYFTNAFKTEGLDVINGLGDFEQAAKMQKNVPRKDSLSYRLQHSLAYYKLQAWKRRRPCKLPENLTDVLFMQSDENIFAGQRLLFKKKGTGIERIEQEIRQSFVFPEINDSKNLECLKSIEGCNSVALHARRGDMLGSNQVYYASGYFKRAVSFIRKHVPDPHFFIFCDPGSVLWAMENPGILGLNPRKDPIYFVDWNKGEESFRDMQLMAACKHQIITNSSFGWWGAWLNTNPDKITISPEYTINTTHTL